jgi:NAD(P)H dehydrogenase (quinone)
MARSFHKIHPNTRKSPLVDNKTTMPAKVAIVYYSLYGHVATMAKSVAKGVEAAGATCDIYQVAETLSDEILGKMGAPPKQDHPIITPDKMAEYDGVLFGLSGRFGAMPAQIKTFMDSCGGLWQKGAMTGKAAGTFTSVATLGGGQESVNISCFSFFSHQGMCFVPLGYTDPQVFNLEEIHGASPYGSGTFANVCTFCFDCVFQ